MAQKATAMAHPNIALIKYWGKRETKLNLPAVGSISITLDHLSTISEVEFSEDFRQDELILNHQPASGKECNRASKFLDLLREISGTGLRAKIVSENNFPTSAGLASSASAFASLAFAAGHALNLNLNLTQYSELARRGSGSAARSIFGGFAEMHHGQKADGTDAVATQIADENYWDLQVLIAVTSEQKKDVGSTEGMQLTAQTSPYYSPWITTQENDLQAMRQAIAAKDFTQMGELSEFSCLKMHALAMSANPGLLYWNATTIELMHTVRNFRKKGLQAYFTIDAGPQVKIITTSADLLKIKAGLNNHPGIKKIIETGLGSGTQIIRK